MPHVRHEYAEESEPGECRVPESFEGMRRVGREYAPNTILTNCKCRFERCDVFGRCQGFLGKFRRHGCKSARNGEVSLKDTKIF